MAVSSVHLMLANLQIRDTPIGYTPPVGPPVYFTLRYNHRDYLLPPSINSTVFGPKWSHDWMAFIRDSPLNPLADVKYVVGGGGARTFTGFDPNTQTFAPQQYDLTRLRRTGPNSYEMVYPDGSKKIFGLRITSGSVLLTRVEDSAGNAVTLSWEETGGGLRLAALTDALGQVTTLAYEHPTQPMLITRITDPFGRFATFDYTFFDFLIQDNPPGIEDIYIQVFILRRITDVVGITSQFEYAGLNGIPQSDIITRMITPYGTNTFLMGQGGGPNGTTRFVETHYPDGSRDRVEYNQSDSLGIPFVSEAVPAGMPTGNAFMYARNTYYWSRTACATSYGDYTKARIYHWMHTPSVSSTSGFLESLKEPLENRVWFYYGGHPSVLSASTVNRPTHIGRVLEDGQTQLYRFGYNSFGNVTNTIDPLGRMFSFVYASNGIDLLEVRQTRAGNNELLARATYNSQHRPLTVTDAAGQTTTFSYNARGQVLTETNPKGEPLSYSYDANGYLLAVDGPLPGTNDMVSATYDALGRTRTVTGVSGYRLTFDYDNLDRLIRVTYPDGTFSENTFHRLDLVSSRDRAGRLTVFEYDALGQLIRQTDPLGRTTRFDWCRCGDLKSLTDPMGRTTSWFTDVQGRLTAKQYADGARINYFYESASSRLRQVIDEKQQVTQFAYNVDDTLRSVTYANSAVPTPGVNFTYDANYSRPASMTDGIGTTRYAYHPITSNPVLGAGALASVDGPLPGDTITYRYDELGRVVGRAINGVPMSLALDALSRVIGVTNALGVFSYAYDGTTRRLLSQVLPNGQVHERSYGGLQEDRALQSLTHRREATPISEFTYGYDIPAGRITLWTQQSGAQSPLLFSFGYDDANRLLSATVTNAGILVNTFAYAYDPADNRLTERVGGTIHQTTYNALNQLSSSTVPGALRTNEWDALDRLTAVVSGNERTEFTYDGLSRLASIRKLVNGAEVSHRRFVWCGGQICEERDAAGAVTKRYFPQGMKVESGPAAGAYFYTRDHLGSIRDVTDHSGNVRARYAYDPFGRPTRLAGDVEADLGFAGMFWSSEVNLSLTHFRAYDPEMGRWLSRDPLRNAELIEGPNLYGYVHNEPISRIDPEGLTDSAKVGAIRLCATSPGMCKEVMAAVGSGSGALAEGAKRAQTIPGIGGVGPAAQKALECARNSLPSLEARIPAFEGSFPKILESDIPRLPSMLTRFRTLVDMFRTRVTPQDFEIVRQHQFYTDDLYEVETVFYNLAWDVHRLRNIPFAEAWERVSRIVGFDPRMWPQL